MYDEKEFRHRPSLLAKSATVLGSFVTALMPSFLHPLLNNNGLSNEPTRIAPTAWLDGLRGYAAFFVFICHFSFAYHQRDAIAYGTIDDPRFPSKNIYIFQLPILRLIVAGDSMVAIFFVISGYALSLKPLRLIRQGSHDQLMRTLASSAFRRPFRLFLPCIASTLLIFFAVRAGVFEYVNTFAEDDRLFRSIFGGYAHEPQVHRYETFREQAWDYYHASAGLFEILTHHHWPSHRYDVHLWTIPVEFRCSMILFLTIAALSHVRSKVRMIVVSVFVLASYQTDTWELGLFWGGMLLAEASLIRKETLQTSDLESMLEQGEPIFRHENTNNQNKKNPLLLTQKSLCYLLFTVSLILMSCPGANAKAAPFYSTLMRYVPPGLDEKYRFWQSMGAFLLIWSANNETSLQRPFSCALGRYLGNISFALYLVHGFVNHSLGYSVVFNLWEGLTGTETLMQYEAGVIMGVVIVIPMVVWLADLFWRFVDVPIVRYTKMLENSLLAS